MWHLNEQLSQDSVHQLKTFVIKRNKKKKKKGFGSVAHLWHAQQGPAQAPQHNQLHVVGEAARAARSGWIAFGKGSKKREGETPQSQHLGNSEECYDNEITGFTLTDY